MKLLILSDSHRAEKPMVEAVWLERPDAIIHLGDHAADAQILTKTFPNIPVCTIRGNCDYSFEPEQVLLDFEGVKIFAVHGHRYGVKAGTLRLYYAGLEQGAQVILYGHTHCAECEEKDGVWLLNPGTCGGIRPTYGLVELSKDKIDCKIKILEVET